MALQIGLVYYANDPTQSVFRVVSQLPWESLSVLDDPAHVTDEILVDVTGKAIPGARPALMTKVPAGNPQGLCGPYVGIGTSAASALINLVSLAPAVAAAIASGASNAATIQTNALIAAQQAAALKGATPTLILAAAQQAALSVAPVVTGQANGN